MKKRCRDDTDSAAPPGEAPESCSDRVLRKLTKKLDRAPTEHELQRAIAKRLLKKSKQAAGAEAEELREAVHSDSAAPAEREMFVHGNYDRYYGYRTGEGADPRVLMLRPEWFRGKECLDIGCNAGRLTLAVANKFKCSSMLGVDIDPSLVSKADQARDEMFGAPRRQYPKSFGLMFGHVGGAEPCVRFECQDFVSTAQPSGVYDAVMCMSVTKWIHFHGGDEGLKLLFRKCGQVHSSLREGGVFIVEPQPWKSYQKKAARLTCAMREQFKTIRLKPSMFVEHLLSEVGFQKHEILGKADEAPGGFKQRPVIVFFK